MQRERDGLVPIGEALADLGGPVQAIREATPQALHHFSRFDQVNQLVSASEADPRVNGPYTLYMVAGGGNKLPYGNLPRLLLAWLCSEAVRTQSRELVLGRSLSKFMRTLGMNGDSGGSRGELTRLRNQMKRLFSAHVSMIYEDEHGEVRVSSLVADRAAFWWTERKPAESSLWNSKIRLGEDLFNEIINHPVPLDLNTLMALKRCALGLDLYLWLTYRTFALTRPLRLTWRQVYQQFGLHPDKSSEKRTVLNFRRKILRELKKIKMAWPELNYTTAAGVLILHPSTPGIAPLNQAQLTS